MSNGLLAEGKSAEKKRVLLVEDNQLFAMVYKDLLSKEGYEVTHVAEGDAALSALQHATYDVVLLDLMLPEMDGAEVLRRTRTRNQTFQTPVIVLTESDLNAARTEMKPFGVKQFFTKTGTHAREILDTIHTLISSGPAGERKQEPATAAKPAAQTNNIRMNLKMVEPPALNVRKINQVGPDPLEVNNPFERRKHRNAAARDMAGFFRRLLWAG
jgi:CheY-like chemotaxis protein